MRKIALFLLILCAALIAESRAPDEIPGPILFQDEEEGAEGAEEEQEPQLPAPEDAAGGEVEDKVGNYKVTLPAGWVVESEPNEDPSAAYRMSITRVIADSDGVLARMEFWRFPGGSDTFSNMTAGEILDLIEKNAKFFEGYYGEGTTGLVTPEMDGGKTLGEADTGEAFEYRAIRPEEDAKIREAENLIRRGEKNVEVPEFKPIVVRGRLALISPYVYLVRWTSARSFADHEGLVAEAESILDSYSFFASGGKPTPLAFGKRDAWHLAAGNTFENAPKKAVKEKRFAKATGRKSYFQELTYKLEPGFASLDQKKIESLSANLLAVIYAQDADNNWVKIVVQNICIKEGTTGLIDIDQQVETWKTNWAGQAERTDIPRRGEKVRYGQAAGEGYKLLTGKIGGFKATFTGIVWQKKGWRNLVEIETRGRGWELYQKQISKVVKSFRFKDK
jgi:hypothetical protein